MQSTVHLASGQNATLARDGETKSEKRTLSSIVTYFNFQERSLQLAKVLSLLYSVSSFKC